MPQTNVTDSYEIKPSSSPIAIWSLEITSRNLLIREVQRGINKTKMKIKKIAAIAGSMLMAGLSMATASAAVFPAPFSTNVASTAVVYGANAASTDQVGATNIQSALSSYATGSSSTTTLSGENVLLQMPNSYLHVGNGVKDVFSRSVTKSDMPTLLADGTYRDASNNDHSYTQKIDMANVSLSQFNLENFDTSVSTSTPAIGFGLDASQNVLNYTLTFQSNVNFTDMQYSNLDLMGKQYYVLGASASTLTLLDSASSANLANGGSTTLTAGNKTYSVKADIFGSDQVQFTVNGETTDLLKKGDTYKLSDGSYIGVKEVSGASYAGGSSVTQFSIGSGKIIMNNDAAVQVNSESVNGVDSVLGTTGGKLSSITIKWNTNDNVALTKDKAITMPAFDGVKLSFAGMTYPSMENTTVSNDGNTAVKLSTVVQDGPVSLDILGMNRTDGNFTYIGKDAGASNTLVTASGQSITDVAQNNEFVISGVSGTKVAESHVYKVGSFSNTTTNGLQVVLNPQDGGTQLTLTDGQATQVGTVTGSTITPTIYKVSGNYRVNFTSDSSSNFGTLYTKDGLKVVLPTSVHVNGNASLPTVQSYPIQFTEADKDGNIAGGKAFNITVGRTGSADSYQTSVTSISNSAGTGVEMGNSNVYSYVVPSALATGISYNQGPTQETAAVTYHGGESYGKLYLASPSATVSSSSGSAMGPLMIKDSEVANTSATNLIVVGGSCVNSAAATLLGGPYCGTDFTAQTGVGAGQFLIEAFPTSSISGKYALLVAGYNAADTTNAVTYLTKAQNVDTSTKIVKTTDAVAGLQ